MGYTIGKVTAIRIEFESSLLHVTCHMGQLLNEQRKQTCLSLNDIRLSHSNPVQQA